MSMRSIGRGGSRRAMATLLWLATERGGYARRGVRGWAAIGDINAILNDGERGLESLRPMANRGHLVYENAALPGTRPLFLYRITPTGIRHVDRAHADSSPAFRSPSRTPDSRFVIPPPYNDPIDQLREASRVPLALAVGPGGTGWRRPSDLRSSAYSWCDPGVLARLADLGYLEVWYEPRAGQALPQPWYRISARGAAIRVATWVEPSSDAWRRLRQHRAMGCPSAPDAGCVGPGSSAGQTMLSPAKDGEP